MYSDAGNYQLGSEQCLWRCDKHVAQVVMHCVNVNGANPSAPYTTWAMAATNIQDAITAAAVGDIVLVTNGIYATGGISVDGLITNRVSVNKAILVQSVNGPNTTIIQGTWDPTSTNGPGAVRCAWLTTNAIMYGFTLFGGATRASGSSTSAGNGGGVCGVSSNSTTVGDCIITGNSAGSYGGGAYDVTLKYCIVSNNIAVNTIPGLGCWRGGRLVHLKNCVVAANMASGEGREASAVGCTPVVQGIAL